MVKVWDAATGQESLTLRRHTMYIRSVAFSPDGRDKTRQDKTRQDKTVKVWDARSWTPELRVSAESETVSQQCAGDFGQFGADASFESDVGVHPLAFHPVDDVGQAV